VVGLKRRLKRLEEVGKREETELSREALRHLSDEDLEALEDALEAGQENGSATFEDLHSVVTERGRRALENLLECIEALSEGREPPSHPEAGEEARQSRNGYRIGKYRK
jgi:predicted transcriptional regulator